MTTAPGPHALMAMHADALYRHDARGRMTAVNEWTAGEPPRVFLGRTVEGHVLRVRSDVSDATAAALEAAALEAEMLEAAVEKAATAESSPSRLGHWPECRRRLEALLDVHSPVGDVWAGPAFWFPYRAKTDPRAVTVTPSNSQLLLDQLPDWLEDVAHRSPFVAVTENGSAAAVCASVRITKRAHEAGVETAVAARRRGHALRAVSTWAALVQAQAAIAMYSTSWENAASRNVAKRLGLEMFGVDYHVR